MKSIFDNEVYINIRERIENIQPNSERLWGSMTISQMMAHCSLGLENALGKTPFVDKSNFILRTLVKRIVLKSVLKGDLGKNQKTFPIYKVTEEKDFLVEKERLLKNLDEFYEKGNHLEIGKHPYFGNFSKDNWGQLQYVHFDHHLRQFSI